MSRKCCIQGEAPAKPVSSCWPHSDCHPRRQSPRKPYSDSLQLLYTVLLLATKALLKNSFVFFVLDKKPHKNKKKPATDNNTTPPLPSHKNSSHCSVTIYLHVYYQ